MKYGVFSYTKYVKPKDPSPLATFDTLPEAHHWAREHMVTFTIEPVEPGTISQTIRVASQSFRKY